ncbi:hypothetical protein [Streptomyces sp. SM12]|uniref:hypothetical protein n=1 Tax=Streptomyces sp. SM12 TaxID=1071602 RepID=UPI000CD5068F|nr:hypothetical protein [Streptomyces sp. SM12]
MPRTLTVGQLIHQLQTLSPDLPVHLAINPDWPYAHAIGRVIDSTGPTGPGAYIAENGQTDILPPAVRAALDWDNG